jgi:hypothetical protein
MKKIQRLNLNPNFFSFLVGIVIFFYGAFQIYPPAAYAVTGVILMSISVFGHEKNEEG